MKRWWLRAQTVANRAGAELTVACGIWALAIVALLVVVPLLQWQLSRATAQAMVQAGTIRSRQDLARAGATEQSRRLAAYYNALGSSADLEQDIAQLFAIARHVGLSLRRGTYRRTEDAAGQYQTYEIELPVHGTYEAVRSFSRQLLLVLPFASLDRVSFKRTDVNSDQLDASLHLTLFLAMDGTAATVARPVGDVASSAAGGQR